jgi:outer membrane lipoprotein-sorting protein
MHICNGRTVRLGALVLWFSAAALAADNLAGVFQRMDQAAPKFKGMRADMKKVSHTAVMNIDETDTGTIVVKVPKPHDFHMLIDFQQPDKKTVEVAGTKVQMYYPKTNEVQEKDFGKGHKTEVEQFLKLGFGSTSKELQDAYTVTYGGPETVAGQKTTRIELVPKSADLAATFPKFELWISDANGTSGISIQQKVYEQGGNYSVATYSNMKLDPNIPDSAVRLNLPKGVTRIPL